VRPNLRRFVGAHIANQRAAARYFAGMKLPVPVFDASVAKLDRPPVSFIPGRSDPGQGRTPTYEV